MSHQVYVIGPRDKQKAPGILINCTSRDRKWGPDLSPFFLGPVQVPDPHGAPVRCERMENAWQYSKVYAAHLTDGSPNQSWYTWRNKGFRSKRADRYPMGRGAKPEFAFWNGQRLGYIDARKTIYVPTYARLVKNTASFKELRQLYDRGDTLWLWDFDGYNHHAQNMSYEDVLHCETHAMGHAFVIAMLLDGFIA